MATTLMAAFVLATVPAFAAESASAAPIAFGMDANSVAQQAAAGVTPDYGTFWVGPWTLSSGWGGPDGQLTTLKNAGVTPAVHFYYWGDDISPSCVENGCWSSLHNAQKDRAHWDLLGTQLTDHLNAKMGGAPVVIFLESEFNKGGIETYEPFDGYMAAMADKIHAAYPNAIIVLGFGNWGSNAWGTFDRAAAASDMVGIQGMRGSTRQTKDQMMTLYDGLLAGVISLETKFPGKPIMLTDLAVSSYPEPDYLPIQRDVLAEVFSNLGTLKSHGVEAVVYRTWKDNPTMNTANYYGEAERHWGLAYPDGTQKAVAKVWIDGVKAERAGSTPTPTPTPAPTPAPSAILVGDGVTTQVEAFASKQAGGKQADGAAQGGAMWNLWSNGNVAQSYNFTGDYDLTVRARGTSAAGVAPHMDVFVGNAKVLSADPGASYTDRTVRVSGNGITDVRIAYTNDAKTASEDRNLILDAVSFAAAPVTPPNRAPAAAFNVTATGLTATVDASASSDPDGDALTYAWSFGDAATATGQTASHTYAVSGTYTVGLTVSDGNHSASTSQDVTVVQPNRAPSASFTATTGTLRASVDASASADPDGDAMTYTWGFGDGATAAGRTASHSYAAAGTYTLTLTVSDGSLAAGSSRVVTIVGPYAATFSTNPASNTWWVQEKVVSTPAPAKVDVRVNGGAWQAMTLQSYGDWTLSANVAKGSQVVFRATAPDGQTSLSPTQSWLGATSTSTTTTSSAPAFKATFSPKNVGNDWWVETAVSANAPVTKVEAKVGSGPYVTLVKQDWGTYAKSINAPNGSQVTFRATTTSGATSTSSPVTWT
ncbi:MAG: PKD domain-containing protein [Candidatus Thermoplasmatota archaeon]